MAFGGYANELVKSPPPELQWECSICLQVVRDPHMVSCCSLRFCRTCIERVQRRGSPCPHCQAGRYSITRDSQLERVLLSKCAFCVNKKKGCEWEGELRYAEGHVKDDCMWAEVGCPNQCSEQILRCNLNQHVEKECPQRWKPCEFAAIGCKSGLLTPDKLQSHLYDSMQSHLTLVCQKLSEVERNMPAVHDKELKDLETKVQRLETEKRELKAIVQRCETDKRDLKARVQACEKDVRKLDQEAKQKQHKNTTMYIFIILLSTALLYAAYTCVQVPATLEATDHFETEWQQKVEELAIIVEDMVTCKETQQTTADRVENIEESLNRVVHLLKVKLNTLFKCPAEKSNRSELQHNKQSINTKTPKTDTADSTDVAQDAEEVGIGGAFVLFILLCCICAYFGRR